MKKHCIYEDVVNDNISIYKLIQNSYANREKNLTRRSKMVNQTLEKTQFKSDR